MFFVFVFNYYYFFFQRGKCSMNYLSGLLKWYQIQGRSEVQLASVLCGWACEMFLLLKRMHKCKQKNFLRIKDRQRKRKSCRRHVNVLCFTWDKARCCLLLHAKLIDRLYDNMKKFNEICWYPLEDVEFGSAINLGQKFSCSMLTRGPRRTAFAFLLSGF